MLKYELMHYAVIKEFKNTSGIHNMTYNISRGINMQNYIYPNIDMKRTGSLLKKKVKEAGYTVKELQGKLRLSCPQPIYRWFKGKVLPSVNHLYALSQLLHVHMEELLVAESQINIIPDIWKRVPCEELTRMYSYLQRIQQAA